MVLSTEELVQIRKIALERDCEGTVPDARCLYRELADVAERLISRLEKSTIHL